MRILIDAQIVEDDRSGISVWLPFSAAGPVFIRLVLFDAYVLAQGKEKYATVSSVCVEKNK